jgi:hypothetical protein
MQGAQLASVKHQTLCLKLLLHYALSDPDAPPSSDMNYEKYVAQQEHSGKGGSATLGHFHEKVYVIACSQCIAASNSLFWPSTHGCMARQHPCQAILAW